MSATVCIPVIRRRSSFGPSLTLTLQRGSVHVFRSRLGQTTGYQATPDEAHTLLKRYALPCRPWKAFEIMSSWSAEWHRQAAQLYTRGLSSCTFMVTSRLRLLPRGHKSRPQDVSASIKFALEDGIYQFAAIAPASARLKRIADTALTAEQNASQAKQRLRPSAVPHGPETPQCLLDYESGVLSCA